jgi:hypothetical protein
MSLKLRGPDQLPLRDDVQLPEPQDASLPRGVLHPGIDFTKLLFARMPPPQKKTFVNLLWVL